MLLLLLVAAWQAFVGDLFVTSRDLRAAQEEQARLVAEVERLRTELALETATRDELESQAAALNARVAELDRQVAFLTSRKGAVPAAN